MITKIFIYTVFVPLFFLSLKESFLLQNNVENRPPSVVIKKPVKNSSIPWNSIVPYAVHVNDPEDGNSEYDEIPGAEVLLMVNYFPRSTDAEKYVSQGLDKIPAPMIQMSKSTCLLCHTSKNKLIGPSFDLIADRYKATPDVIEALANKVISGSTGTWGELIMPTHPDLKIEEVKKMVSWILTNGSNPNQSFHTGIEGIFRTAEKPGGAPGVYTITASYTDHGISGIPKSNKQGRHTLIFRPN